MAKIYVSTPVAGNECTTAYTRSLINLYRTFTDVFPGSEILEPEFLSSAMLTTSRNVAASRVLADQSLTHCLFIDADMGFAPDLIHRMLHFDKPVVATLYPRRSTFSTERFYRYATSGASPQDAVRMSLDYVASESVIADAQPDGTNAIQVQEGFVRVRQAGTGIMLIKREALETLADEFPELLTEAGVHRNSWGIDATVLQCFSQLKDEITNMYLSEDISFCRRWTRNPEHELWACIDAPISHTGFIINYGRYLDQLTYQGPRF